jgi:hypothetical protein
MGRRRGPLGLPLRVSQEIFNPGKLSFERSNRAQGHSHCRESIRRARAAVRRPLPNEKLNRAKVQPTTGSSRTSTDVARLWRVSERDMQFTFVSTYSIPDA